MGDIDPSTDLIVAIDDNEDDRFLFSRLLQKAGITFPVRLFASGVEATEELASVTRAPAVCFLDVKMDVMTGFDVLSWLRQQQAFKHTPVVMLSSSDHPADLDRARRLGAQCYVRKHPSEEEMRLILELATAARQGTVVDWTKCRGNLLASNS